MISYQDEIYEKVKRVIWSCKTFGHLLSANQYVYLYLKNLPIYLLEIRRKGCLDHLTRQKKLIKYHKLENKNA